MSRQKVLMPNGPAKDFGDVVCEGNSCRKLRPGEKKEAALTPPETPRAKAAAAHKLANEMQALLNIQEDLVMLVKAADMRAAGRLIASAERRVLDSLVANVESRIIKLKRKMSKGTTR